MHAHRDQPGILARVVDVLNRLLSIAAQFLQTDGELGYVVISRVRTTIHAPYLYDRH